MLPILFVVGAFAVLYMAWMTPFAFTDLERFQNMMKVGGILVLAFAVPQLLGQLKRRQVEVDEEGWERPGVTARPVFREEPVEKPVSPESRSLLFLGVGMMLLDVLMVVDVWVFGAEYGFPQGLLMGLGLALVVLMLPRVVPDIEGMVFPGRGSVAEPISLDTDDVDDLSFHPWYHDYVRRLREKQRKALKEQREK